MTMKEEPLYWRKDLTIGNFPILLKIDGTRIDSFDCGHVVAASAILFISQA